jgi:hypothetical protein
MGTRIGPGTLLLLAMLVVCRTDAQVIEGRPRPTVGPFAERVQGGRNRPGQVLLLTLNVGGGYDESLDPLDQLGPVDRFTLPDSGYAIAASARVDYRKGTLTKYFTTFGRVYHTRAETAAGQPIGGNADVEFGVPIGRKNGFTAGAGASYVPTYLFNAYTPLEAQLPEGTPAPVQGPTQGITEQRWIASQAFAGLFRNWTPRQRTMVQYESSRRETTQGLSQETRTQYGSVRHQWSPLQSLQLQFGYKYGDFRVDQVLSGAPLHSHTADGSVRLIRRMSPTRNMSFSFGGGVTSAETVSSLQVVSSTSALPTAFGGMQVDLNRTWSVGVDLRRDVTTLDSLAPQAYATNAVAGRVGGMIGNRTELAFSWSSSYGSADTGSFETRTGIGQVQYMLMRSAAVFAAYTYYQHRLENIALIQAELPRRYTLSSIRFGVTLWLEPLS